VKAALSDVSTPVFLAIRFTLATSVLALLWRGSVARSNPNAGQSVRYGFRAGLAAGVCLTAAYLLQATGLRLTTATKSAFVTALNVPLVPLLGAAVYYTAPRRIEIAGIAVAMSGMALLTLPEGSLAWNLGDLLTLGAALAFSAHILVVGHSASRAAFRTLSFTQIATAAVLLAAACLAPVGPLHISWTPRLIAAFAVTSLLCTALAFTVQAWAQQRTTSTRAALVFALEPVAAWITAWLVTGESLSVRGAFGAGLILAGVLLVELKPAQSKQHP
jgi:drug/metabolite transporter (DMT)-like permease